jgi:2-dehydropantoate 2-reductase
MKILVYGAGVIGTLYAARLGSGGHQVTVLARSQRLGDTRQNGLVIEDVPSGVRSVAVVDTTERLGPDDRSDLAIMLDETGVRGARLYQAIDAYAGDH